MPVILPPLPTISLDKPTTLKPAVASTVLKLSEMHHTYGTDHADVDVQDDQGVSRRLPYTLTGAQQAQLEAIHLAAINAALGVISTKVP